MRFSCRHMPSTLFCLLFFFLSLAPSGAREGGFPQAKHQEELAAIIHSIPRQDMEQIGHSLTLAQQMRLEAEDCVKEAQAALAPLAQSLEPVAGDLAAIRKDAQLTPLQGKAAEQQKRLAACRYLAATADQAQNMAMARKRRLQARELFYRQWDIFALASQVNQERLSGFAQDCDFIDGLFRAPWLRLALPWMAAAAFLSLVTGIFLVFRGRRWLAALLPSCGDTPCFSHAAGALAFVPISLSAAGAALTARLFDPGPELVTPLPAIFFSLSLIVALQSLAAFPAIAGKAASTDEKKKEGLWLARLAINAFAAALVFFVLPLQEHLSPMAAAGLRLATALLVLASLLLFLVHERRDQSSPWRRRCLRLITFAALLVAAACLSGFYNLGGHILQSVAGSIVGWLLLSAGCQLTDTVVGGLATGLYPWQRHLRRQCNIRDNAAVVSIVWLRLLARTICWVLFLFLVIQLWDPTNSAIPLVVDLLLHGVDIGSIRLVPARIFFGLLTFASLWTFFGWVAGRIKNEMHEERLPRAARETTAALFTYGSFGLAIVFGLVTAGMEFRNLAIIAGALSVGIGFGLQNIVNNFVSGLILLFERPIKTGDWIAVGSTEGHVTKISVRSTIIRTFDNADVIVPNSELIANQVTNWMLTDNTGRVRVPVGVAYGSDTDLVKRLLLAAACAHPLLVPGEGQKAPMVIFTGFGASALDFELRFFISDIDKRLATKSDINFAIDKSFRSHGITIPFPQRDVHIKETPRSGDGEKLR